MSNVPGSFLAAVLVAVLLSGVEPGLAGESDTTHSIELHVVDDAVTLRFTADRRTDIHVHGYELKAIVEPGETLELSFVASATGRFPITTHGPGGAHVTLQYLEVHPR